MGPFCEHFSFLLKNDPTERETFVGTPCGLCNYERTEEQGSACRSAWMRSFFVRADL